jgi:hypothetical protein
VADVSGAIKIPDWVPAAVSKVAKVAAIPPCVPGTVTHRLLTDKRMESVWRQLRRRQVARDVARRFDENERLSSYNLSERRVSANERACAAFFICVASRIGSLSPRKVWTLPQAKKQAAQWASAGELCRSIMDEPMFFKQRAAASTMADFFEKHAESLEEKGCFANLDQRVAPYILGRSSRRRGDDIVRAHARAIAADVHRIFGAWLDGTVATVAAVALGRPQKISRKSMENWRKNLH